MPPSTLDLRDKQHPSHELPPKVNRTWHLSYTNEQNREKCLDAGKALLARINELKSDKTALALGDLPEKLKDCGLKRAFHDELGVRKVVFTFCDDMLTNVYTIGTTWKLFEPQLLGLFKAAGVNPNNVIRCLLAELGPGISIPVHHDTGYWATRSHRVHMPLITSPSVAFFTGKTEDDLVRVPFPEFELIELNNRAKHKVNNDWDKPRVHLIFDYVEDHVLCSLKFQTLQETDKIIQTRRTIRILKHEEKESETEEKDLFDGFTFETDESTRKNLTLQLIKKIEQNYVTDPTLGTRFVKEFIKLSKRYSEGELNAIDYVAFLDRAFLNRDSANDIVKLLFDRERAKTLYLALHSQFTNIDYSIIPENENVLRFKTFFAIVGAMKCGTTSLYEYLNEHPSCIRSRQKEPHAFDWVWNQLCALPGSTLSEKYMKAFNAPKDQYSFTGEATPSYLLGGVEVLRRLKSAVPHAKILVILRDPVERSWSHYQMTTHVEDVSKDQLRRRGSVAGKSFTEVIQEDINCLKNCLVDAEATIPSEFEASYLSSLPTGHGAHSYVGRGLYALQIELLLQVFPRSQVLFLKLEDLSKNLNAEMERVFRFLEVKPCEIKSTIHNPKPQTLIKSSDDIVALDKLRDYYRPHNERLRKLVPELNFDDWCC